LAIHDGDSDVDMRGTPKRRRLSFHARSHDNSLDLALSSASTPSAQGVPTVGGDSCVEPSQAAALQTSDTSTIDPAKDMPVSDAPATRKHKLSARKRTGTPPLTFKTNPAADPESHGPTITDPVRAALTWHEDEITIYDSADSDDDGEGVNGIGFKPTPAIAHARSLKRRQQLAEYRKREDSEARARRMQRRRAPAHVTPGLIELKSSVERRRVRFLDSPAELLGI